MTGAVMVVCILLGVLGLGVLGFLSFLLREPKPRPDPQVLPPPRVIPPAPREPTGYEWGKQRLDDLIVSAEAELRRLEREAGLDEW